MANTAGDKPISSLDGLPTKEQLECMLRRYRTIRLNPLDNNQESMTVSTAISEFRQPIFLVDGGNDANRVALALQYQAAFPQTNPSVPSRIMVDGNLNLVQTAFNVHKKLLGDDPYNPEQPFDNQLMLMEGQNIPEYQLYENTADESKEEEKIAQSQNVDKGVK